MPQQVTIKSRTTLPAATIDDPDRKIIQTTYQVGDLPPHFVYVDAKGWTKEKEAEAIKKDLKKIQTKPLGETVDIED